MIDEETETVTEIGMNVIEMVTGATTIVGTGGTTIVRGRGGTVSVPMAVTGTEKEDTIGIGGGMTGAEIDTEVERTTEPGEVLHLLEE